MTGHRRGLLSRGQGGGKVSHTAKIPANLKGPDFPSDTYFQPSLEGFWPESGPSERPVRESDPPAAFRRRQAGSAGQGKRDRGEYMRQYQREWVAKRRAEWFSDKSCVDCGATERLELDHRDPALKTSNRIWSWARWRRAEEIAKCDVRCNACHKKRHGPAHGGKRRYEAGCRCEPCVTAQRERRRARNARATAKPAPPCGGLCGPEGCRAPHCWVDNDYEEKA